MYCIIPVDSYLGPEGFWQQCITSQSQRDRSLKNKTRDQTSSREKFEMFTKLRMKQNIGQTLVASQICTYYKISLDKLIEM